MLLEHEFVLRKINTKFYTRARNISSLTYSPFRYLYCLNVTLSSNPSRRCLRWMRSQLVFITNTVELLEYDHGVFWSQLIPDRT